MLAELPLEITAKGTLRRSKISILGAGTLQIVNIYPEFGGVVYSGFENFDAKRYSVRLSIKTCGLDPQLIVWDNQTRTAFKFYTE